MMLELLWLIVAMPLAAFLVLALLGRKMPDPLVAITGTGGAAISAFLVLLMAWQFHSAPPQGYSYTQHLWQWMEVGGLNAGITLHLDPLSLVFIFVITFVGSLILLYSTEFMKGDEGYSRFFAYMNLFITSMLVLVLANNLLLMYFGWEGVGLCSYLLIGFWYKDPANGYAARKAFIITRIGDTAMAIGLFLLFLQFNTLNISSILGQAQSQWQTGASMATLAAFLLLGGALGKSAQLPLQTWLPDAMAGPSPVSALIHAATMVTAGVYLIARTHVLFDLAPMAQHTVAVIGALTLLLAGFSALAQRDIKRVLAYSTISQIGYMFLALGVGAWSAAIFHFMIHAFFKALLFLGAGAIIMVLHHEHDMFKMGGLRKRLPVTFWMFLIASASLAALPLISAGFYSKDLILWQVFASPKGGTVLWLMGFIGAFLTALYTFRMVFITFFGEVKTEPERRPGWKILVPLVVLGFLSFAGGFIELPHTLGHLTLFSGFVNICLPKTEVNENIALSEGMLQVITGLTTLVGVFLAYWLFIKKRDWVANFSKQTAIAGLAGFLLSGWRFDTLYDLLFVKPIVTLSKINKNDFIDLIYTGIAKTMAGLNALLALTQNGKLRWYMAGIAIGAVLILTIVSVL